MPAAGEGVSIDRTRAAGAPHDDLDVVARMAEPDVSRASATIVPGATARGSNENKEGRLRSHGATLPRLSHLTLLKVAAV